MTAKYVFDSNIFIELQRRQPLDIYPSLWKKIGCLMEDGIIISSHEVFEEIAVGNDVLASWVKQREDSFLLSSESIQLKVRDILKDFRELVESGKKMNNADPFVIAVAQENNCKVVTSETLAGGQALKIPNVCLALHVDYMDFVAFQREMQLAF